jgi:hypothetical protein
MFYILVSVKFVYFVTFLNWTCAVLISAKFIIVVIIIITIIIIINVLNIFYSCPNLAKIKLA